MTPDRLRGRAFRDFIAQLGSTGDTGSPVHAAVLRNLLASLGQNIITVLSETTHANVKLRSSLTAIN
jgi:hypothetical protein